MKNFGLNKFRFLQIVLNPYLLALEITLAVILIWPNNITKYKATITDVEKDPESELFFFEDIDGNGFGDKISIGKNFIGNVRTSLMLYPDMAREQWNYKGDIGFSNNHSIITGDYDNNGIKEIYSFTRSSDSLFVHTGDYERKFNPLFTNKFIAILGTRNGKTDASIITAQMDDLNDDGKKELIFAIVSGFGIFPRQVFAYDIANDSLYSSPLSGFHITNINQYDVTGDGKNEILLSGFASDNIQDTSYPYKDHFSWVTILDRRLQFLFPPAEVHGVYGAVISWAINYPETTPVFGYLINPPGSQQTGSRLVRYNFQGKIMSETILPVEANSEIGSLFNVNLKNKQYVGLGLKNGSVLLYDTTLTCVHELYAPFAFDKAIVRDQFNHKPFDLDGDGKNEIAFLLWEKEQLVISRNDLSHPVIINVPLTGWDRTTLSLKKNGQYPSELVLHTGNNLTYISYEINTFYYLRWLIFGLVYLGILSLSLLLRKIQRIQMQRKFDTEKKINELQLKIIGNQLDPHFTLNALNSVIDSLKANDSETAGIYLHSFTKMFRSLVLSSDKFRQTLAEELEFTENYMRMEQFRFNSQFQYKMDILPGVNPEWEVPKMIVQSHVENAIKHGLACKKEKKGLIEISVKHLDHKLEIAISDNGAGRAETSAKKTQSTRKGLEMMNNLYDLYDRITNTRITSQIVDLYDDENKPAGTRVTLTIPVKPK